MLYLGRIIEKRNPKELSFGPRSGSSSQEKPMLEAWILGRSKGKRKKKKKRRWRKID